MLSSLPPARRPEFTAALARWPWRFRRAGRAAFTDDLPTWRISDDLRWVAPSCRVFAGTAETIEAEVGRPGFEAMFGRAIRAIEILGDTAPRRGALQVFGAARAVAHAAGPLIEGPWPALEGRLAAHPPMQARRLALHGAVSLHDLSRLSVIPLQGLWLGPETAADALAAVVGTPLGAAVQRLWTGSALVEDVLALGRWPALRCIGGTVMDHAALAAALPNAPRLTALDLVMLDLPDLPPLTRAGVRCIRFTEPLDLAPVIAQPPPRGLRCLGITGRPDPDTVAALADWAGGRLSVVARPVSGLAWLGY